MIASRWMHDARAIVFDLDGTLVDSYGPITSALNATRAAFGLAPVERAQVLREVGHGVRQLVAGHVAAEQIERAVALFESHYATDYREATLPIPGVQQALNALQGRWPMAVASNKPSSFSRGIVEACGWAEILPIVLGPDGGFAPKPEPAMVRAACRELGWEPHQVLYVGDMPLDVETARRAGVGCALVATGSASEAELRATGVLPVLRTLAELPRWLGGSAASERR